MPTAILYTLEALERAGFGTVRARDIRPDMEVAYVESFLGAGSERFRISTVLHVRTDEQFGEVTVHHTAGITLADDGDLVWAGGPVARPAIARRRAAIALRRITNPAAARIGSVEPDEIDYAHADAVLHATGLLAGEL